MTLSTTYYVLPNHYSSHRYTNNNNFTLQHYLNNANKYFASHNQLHLLPGQHYICSDLVLELIYNFTLSGEGTNQSVIACSLPVKITLKYIDNFTIKNIALITAWVFQLAVFIHLY